MASAAFKKSPQRKGQPEVAVGLPSAECSTPRTDQASRPSGECSTRKTDQASLSGKELLTGLACGAGFGLVAALLAVAHLGGVVSVNLHPARELARRSPESAEMWHSSFRVQEHPEQASCNGNASDVCKCLLQCEVFGGQPERCDGRNDNEKLALVGRLIHDAGATTASHGSTAVDEKSCQEMYCVMRCAKKLGCHSQRMRDSCQRQKNKTSSTCSMVCEEEDVAEIASGANAAPK